MKTCIVFIIILNLSCSVMKLSYEKKSGFIIENEPFKTLIFIETQETQFDQFVIKNFQNTDFLRCIDTLPNTFLAFWYDDESLMKFNENCNILPGNEIQYLYVSVDITSKRKLTLNFETDEYYFDYNKSTYCMNVDRRNYIIVKL